MKEIEAPDGTIIEFPQGMSDTDIAAAMRRLYPAPAQHPGPSTLQQRGQEVFGFDPDVTHRNPLLPFVQDKEGKVEFGWPQVAVDMAEGFILPGHVAQGGSYTEQDVTRMGMDFNPVVRSPAGRGLMTKREFIKRSPSEQKIAKQANKLYKKIDSSGITFDAEDFGGLLGRMETRIGEEGAAKGLTDKSLSAFKALADNFGKSPTLKQMETMRKQLNIARMAPDPADRRMAGIMMEMFDDFVGESGAIPKQARALWARRAKVATIDNLVDRAGRSASGFENGLRTEFRRLLNNERKMRGFTKAEKDAITKVVNGGPWRSTLRMLSHFGPAHRGSNRFLGSTIGAGGGAAAGGAIGGPIGAGAGAVGVPAAGHLAGRGAERATEQAVNYARALAAAGGQTPRLRSSITAMPQKNIPRLLGTQLPPQYPRGPNGGWIINGEEVF